MDTKDIKSGSQVVCDFLNSLQGDGVIDTDTLVAVRDLVKTGKLSRTRLLHALEGQRANAISKAKNVAPEGKGDVDD